MVFSSSIFVFAFMPIAFTAYILVPSSWRNYVLFVSSLAFYFFGEGPLLILLVASAIFNYGISIAMHKGSLKKRRLLLKIGLAGNLIGLIYFKYANLLIGTVHDLGLSLAWVNNDIILPIGISFYTFQGMSYLMDVSAGRTEPPKKFIDFGTYLIAFPQLIAGPIVRYADIKTALLNRKRKVTIDDLYCGVVRFIIGLSKKILIADSVAFTCDKAFALPNAELSFMTAWLGALAYAMQIYFDFSGYSDMAIGMGRMLGFHYPENFNQPYISKNFTEFWRRWHISLSTWFRDYLYFPLGGNRCGMNRTLLNLLIVFALCGLWHGAAWHFMIWGLLHGTFLLIERFLRIRYNWQPHGLIGWLYTFLAVIIAWVLFRAENINSALAYFSSMFAMNGSGFFNSLNAVISFRSLFAIGLGLLLSLTPNDLFRKIIKNDVGLTLQYSALSLTCFIVSMAIIARYGFNVFIYFQF